MYLAIILLPLLGSSIAGFWGRKIGVKGSQTITCFSIIITTMLSIIAYIEVGINNKPIYIELFRWIDIELLNISWTFYFDSLTVSMLIPVLVISSLVHTYSISYMNHDPQSLYGDKLSNSGNTLKFKIPNHNGNIVGGWSNYSGKVTSLKINKNKMDDRGSKLTL